MLCRRSEQPLIIRAQADMLTIAAGPYRPSLSLSIGHQEPHEQINHRREEANLVLFRQALIMFWPRVSEGVTRGKVARRRSPRMRPKILG
jgi:hypothetical protein